MKWLLFIASIFALTGCQKKEDMQTVQVLKINNQGDLASLHPHTGIDLNCRTFQKALFECLTRITPEGSIELAAAENVDISEDGKTYTFTLRPMIWTNGEKVTAHHFENAWKSAIQPVSTCLRSDLFYVIKNAQAIKKGELSIEEAGIWALDDQTFRVELEHPSPYFLELLTCSLFSPLFNDDEQPMIFNGPFKLHSWEHEKKLVLEKNEDYWDADHVQLERVEAFLVNDPNTAMMMYEKQEIDFIGLPFTMIPTDMLPNVSSSPDFHSQPLSAVFWLCLNTDTFPLNSKKLRQALSVAIDRKTIAEHTLHGELASKSMIPSSIQLLKEQELYPDANQEIAQKLFSEALEELKISKEEFPPLQISYGNVPGQKVLVEAIQQRWEKCFDIEIKLTGSDWNTFFTILGQRQYQIGGCIWFSVFNDPIYNLEFFKYKDHRYNAPCWENAQYQHLLELADQEVNVENRNAYLKEAEQLLLDEMPIIPLYVVNSKYLKAQKVKDLLVSDLGQVDFKWAHVE